MPAPTFREFHIMNPVFGGFGFFFKAKRFLFLVVWRICQKKKNINHHVTHSLQERLKSSYTRFYGSAIIYYQTATKGLGLFSKV